MYVVMWTNKIKKKNNELWIGPLQSQCVSIGLHVGPITDQVGVYLLAGSAPIRVETGLWQLVTIDQSSQRIN